MLAQAEVKRLARFSGVCFANILVHKDGEAWDKSPTKLKSPSGVMYILI